MRAREARVKGYFVALLACYSVATFTARAFAKDGAASWTVIVNGTSTMLLVIVALVVTFAMQRQAAGTTLERSSVIGWLAHLVGVAVLVVATEGDGLAFMTTIIGIGAGIVTQAAFHYGFIGARIQDSTEGHRTRLQFILSRARR